MSNIEEMVRKFIVRDNNTYIDTNETIATSNFTLTSAIAVTWRHHTYPFPYSPAPELVKTQVGTKRDELAA